MSLKKGIKAILLQIFRKKQDETIKITTLHLHLLVTPKSENSRSNPFNPVFTVKIMGYFTNPYRALELQSSTIIFPEMESFVSTGLAVAGSTEDGYFEVPIFQTRFSAEHSNLHWFDLYFPSQVAPSEYLYLGGDSKPISGGEMIRLQCLLYALDEKSHQSIGLINFLTDLAESTGVSDETLYEPNVASIELIDPLREKNYFIHTARPHGREIDVYLNKWLPFNGAVPSLETPSVRVTGMNFRPKADKSLNKPRWRKWDNYSISRIFMREFLKLGIPNPSEMFTEKGVSQLLEKFTWSKLSLMTNSEARAARVLFIQKNPNLVSNPKQLAESLKKAELYAPGTSNSQIAKFLPSLIKQAFPKD